MTTRIAARYSKALFLSADKSVQQDLLEDFENLLDVYNKVPKLDSFLNSPEISRKQKEGVLNIPFKNKPEFLAFLSLLLQKGRFKYLLEIAEEYRSIYTNAYGKTIAHLTTAIPLETDIQERFKEKLNHMYSKQFDLTCEVNPQIIGGGVLVIADRMIDFSVKNKLDRLKSHLEKS